MADFPLLDRTQWDLIYPPAVVAAVSASANADAQSATVLVDFLVAASSAGATANAGAATVTSGFTALSVQAGSAHVQADAWPCGVVQQGAEITTLWARPTTTTTILGIEAASLFGPRALTTTLTSAAMRSVLLADPMALTLLAGISTTTLHATPELI